VLVPVVNGLDRKGIVVSGGRIRRVRNGFCWHGFGPCLGPDPRDV